MPSNKGITNEFLIAEALNNKSFFEINRNLQTMMRDIFGYEDEKEIIKCERVEGVYKPDLCITYKGVKKYVSVKEGRANMVHGENIKTFILYLRSFGISKETQKTILYYHFGDGTMTGDGKKRMDSYEARDWLHKEIKLANDELNKNKDLIHSFLERTMYQGIDETAPNVDYIYFGTPEYGVIVSKKQIQTYVDRRNWRYFDNLHIGPIFLKPHARYAHTNINSVERREKVHCYWPNLAMDLDMISKRYSF